MAEVQANSLYALPNELLIQIASHLDVKAPSVSKFAHEPTTELTSSQDNPLKNLSCVSWRLRRIVIPILFKYVRVPLDQNPQWVPLDARLIESMQGQLSTLSNHEFMIYTKMRSKFKSSSAFAFDQSFDDILINLCRIQEGDEFLKSSPTILWFPHLSGSFTQLGRFVSKYQLKQHIKSVVVHTDIEYELRHVSTADAPLARAVNEIWTHIFSCLEPSRVVVAAPPATLAGLLDTQMLSSDTWAFDMKIHYIELVHTLTPPIDHMRSSCRPWNTMLIHRRPWTHIGYNEGSSITAYSTYEYHLKQSPKMMYLILMHLAKKVESCSNITSFSFTGIFPFATNVKSIIRALHRVPTLRNVTFQLAPGPENNLLSQPDRMGRAQSGDFWLEWTESYKAIASYLGVFDFEDSAEFRSRDCTSETLTRDVEEIVELLNHRGAGWRKKEGVVGVWVRDHALDDFTALGIDQLTALTEDNTTTV
ncbi:uncharacterized protein M421DRAFT_415504 [Didymella exigua CBS 183.55]|uniref:F-box domain-containing protein n=1 Tax=Didymella exigua CBS 183.55 TaxID=1150837 RepID=A0A6A5S0M4_9PLEO|nr:uncharacterized protein M421DRAFT_415504 [Didymella exigua CBS 183.55]KAF1933140.1 hypothetical protein M421DRAFT_415504 [Didymella exigua CBS 183.55]